jgi:hypothetical protein
MQIQARADGRRSLHPLCMLLGRLGDCVLGPSAPPSPSDQAARPYVGFADLDMA